MESNVNETMQMILIVKNVIMYCQQQRNPIYTNYTHNYNSHSAFHRTIIMSIIAVLYHRHHQIIVIVPLNVNIAMTIVMDCLIFMIIKIIHHRVGCPPHHHHQTTEMVQTIRVTMAAMISSMHAVHSHFYRACNSNC